MAEEERKRYEIFLEVINNHLILYHRDEQGILRYRTRVKAGTRGYFPSFGGALEKALINLRDIDVIKEEEFDFELRELGRNIAGGVGNFHYSEGIISKRQ